MVQKQLGVDQPDYGMLFSNMDLPHDSIIPWKDAAQYKVEAEIAFILSKDLNNEDCGMAEVMRAVEYVVPCLEIVASRIANWDIKFVDTVADNGSSAFFTLGPSAKRLDKVDLLDCKMQMTLNKKLVSEGIGRACLGSPLNALQWLARIMAKANRPLSEGDVVLSGALGPMVAATAGAHQYHSKILIAYGKQVIDLTPAAIGPFTIPSVNIDDNLDQMNVNMVTCSGQATIPMVAAINRVSKVYYGEIIASIASKSAGPGTRANIDEFTKTTADAIEQIGGATMGKAIIILNPAEPPMIMRDTIFCLCDDANQGKIRQSIKQMEKQVQEYVPGYRLKQEVQFEHIGGSKPLLIPEMGEEFTGLKVSVYLEVEGAAHYLPAYAGNLDIMTSAAMRTAERLSIKRNWLEVT